MRASSAIVSGVTLALFALLASPASVTQAAAPEGDPEIGEFDYDWAFVYYMAYDNNLEHCGRPIIDMLGKGITSDRLAVVVSADARDTEGMYRYVLTKGEDEFKEKRYDLEEEGSAEEAVLAVELDWVKRNISAKKYAVVFLNHGGQLGQMSYDEHPGKEGGQNWLYPPKVAKVLTSWRKDVQGEVELMFYQQCGKGTLENYHAMKDTARYVMGSQYIVGAPNYYYTKMIKWASEHPEADGKAVSEKIREYETNNMFTTYSTLDCEALKALPEKLNAVLEPLLEKETVTFPQVSGKFRPCFRFRPDEFMFDGILLLEQLYSTNEVDEAPLSTFKDWVEKELVVGHRVSPSRTRIASETSGFSIYFPTRERGLDRYKDYPIFEQTQLDELVRKVLTRGSGSVGAGHKKDEKKKTKKKKRRQAF